MLRLLCSPFCLPRSLPTGPSPRRLLQEMLLSWTKDRNPFALPYPS